jgi:hypothetical protein
LRRTEVEMERDAMKSASQCQTSRCFHMAHVQVEEPQPRGMTDTESTFSGPICIISGCKKHSDVWRGQENMLGCKRNILTLLKKKILDDWKGIHPCHALQRTHAVVKCQNVFA